VAGEGLVRPAGRRRPGQTSDRHRLAASTLPRSLDEAEPFRQARTSTDPEGDPEPPPAAPAVGSTQWSRLCDIVSQDARCRWPTSPGARRASRASCASSGSRSASPPSRSTWSKVGSHLRRRGGLSWRTTSRTSCPSTSSSCRRSASPFCTSSWCSRTIVGVCCTSTSPRTRQHAGPHSRSLTPFPWTNRRATCSAIGMACTVESSEAGPETWGSRRC